MSFEMDRLSITDTLASFQTSSTVTAYADETASIATLKDTNGPEKPKTKRNLSGPETWGLPEFIEIIASSEETLDAPQEYALTNVFALVHIHGQVDRVVEELVALPHEELLTVLRRLAAFRSMLPYVVSEFNFIEEPHLTKYMDLRGRVDLLPTWSTDSRQTFLGKLISRHPGWASLTCDVVDSICAAFEVHQPLTKFLFPLRGQDLKQPPRHIHHTLIYAALPWKVTWPPLRGLLAQHVMQIPYHSPISFVVSVLPDRDTLALASLVERIIQATRPKVTLDPTQEDIDELALLLESHDEGQLDEAISNTARKTPLAQMRLRHPVWPYLWFAMYLANVNSTAALRLIDGGIVDNVRDLYDSDFPDPRPTENGRVIALYSRYELIHLCYILLRVLFRCESTVEYNPQAGMRAKAEGQAEMLREFMRGDLRERERMLSARWHDPDVLYRDEVDAEWRDRKFREENASG